LSVCLSVVVLSVGLLWPNGEINQDEIWHGGSVASALATLCYMGTQLSQRHSLPSIFGPCMLCTKFGTAVGVTDIITCDKFFGDWLKGVDYVGGRKLPFLID